MNIPLLIAAFGTTPAALATYSTLEGAIRRHFPEHEIIWSYAAKAATKLTQQGGAAPLSPAKALRQLAARGYDRVMVQSLHLLPGAEFHELQRIVQQSGISCAMGMPLFCTPEDYDELGEILRPVIGARPGKAILLLGHGTTHPSWTAYFCLEKILRRKFGDRIFAGVLEKFPDSKNLPDDIKAAGFTEVCVIPFLFIAGMHYHRDIAGDSRTSWMTRLHDNDLAVEIISHGLGLFPGLEKLLIRHIDDAMQKFVGSGLSQENSR